MYENAHHLVITLDNENEANVLKLEQEKLGIEVYVPVAQDPNDIERLRLVGINDIDIDEVGRPFYEDSKDTFYTITEKDLNRLDTKTAMNLIDEAFFQFFKKKNFSLKAVITQSPKDKHPHHSLVGNVALMQRGNPTNILTSAHEAFGEGLVCDHKSAIFVPVENNIALANLAELQVQSEVKWDEPVSHNVLQERFDSYLREFEKTFGNTESNWYRVIGLISEKDKEKKVYHSLAQKIGERLIPYANTYQSKKMENISQQLNEILYPLFPIDYRILRKGDLPVLYIGAHQDDRNISFWSYLQ